MKTIKIGVPLLLLFTLYYLLPLEFRHLWQPDETRYAEISREMLVSGNWIVPHFLDLRYFEKPVAGYWINNLSQLLFGHNNFSVRFGSVFSITLTACMVYWLAWRLWHERKTALIAAVIFLTSFLVYGIGTYSVLDPMITLWLTAAMCSFWLAAQATSVRHKVLAYLLLGVTCGMGFMTKGFLALAVPVLGVLPWVIRQRRWKEVLLCGPLAILSAVLISLPWALAIAQREPDFWHYFFWVEHIQRFAEDNAQHKAPFWYYLPVLLAGSLPWLALLPGALWRGWQQKTEESGSFYLLGWVVMPLLFFSIAKGKLPTYILPCFAPLAVLMAGYARQLAVSGSSRVLRINGWINLLFGVICVLVVLVALAPWGISTHSLYDDHEVKKVILACAAFLFWALSGAFSLRQPLQRWLAAALCPLGVALTVGSAMPQQIMDAKQPQDFIASVRDNISGSRYVLADSPGVAAAVGWELKRSDIMLYEEKGELTWGLDYPDAQQRFVGGDAFAGWLAEHRRNGTVSLILLLPRDDNGTHTNLPTADLIYRQGRLILYQYHQLP
ncbi:lipid IV(A) 4-amino-4-deoxy-L-arabinosyltransferase [Pantoea sp. B65]|uniref:lipid IV(A) 4-amino-4-deoxy-L-arabinosyltransferase n=1 Tax=Pantoea sp. B65 TaxID=2813359 RepID=UPI0039B4EB48